MLRLHQDTCRPDTCVPDEQLVSADTCRRTQCRQIQVARSGHMLTVSRRHNYYSFISRSTCIHPVTDVRQTGNNFVADTRNMLTATSGYNLCPDVKAASECGLLAAISILPLFSNSIAAASHSLGTRPELPWRNTTIGVVPEEPLVKAFIKGEVSIIDVLCSWRSD